MSQYDPFAVDFRQAYLQAIKELGVPYPSVKFDDWKLWNEITGGLRSREFSIICGPTGCGKTTFFANMSNQLVKAGVKHFVMSVETGHTDYVKRWISTIIGMDVNQGNAVPASVIAEITKRCLPIVQKNLINFSLYDDRIPLEKLLMDLSYQIEQGCKVAFIDNLNFLLDGGSGGKMLEEMDRVVHSLIIFAKRNPIHLFLVMHPRKTEDERVTSLFDIKGSSTAVQEAHNVFLLNRPSEDSMKAGRSPFERELKVVKLRRRGQYVGRTIVYGCEQTVYRELQWR